MKRLDYLPGTSVFLYQDDEMFKINSDTRFLGEFIKIKKDDVVLDIGVNNGALLLYANIIGCKKLIGVDINDRAIKLCEENMILNNINNYELYACKVQNLDIEKVDVVVCNPPFFKKSIINKKENFAKARHDESLNLDELLISCKRLVRDNGRIMMVYKSNEIVYLCDLMNKYDFGIIRMQFVFDEFRDNSTIVLVEAKKGRKHDVKVSKPLFITH